MSWTRRRLVFVIVIVLLPVLLGLTHVRPFDLSESDAYYDLAKFFSGQVSIGEAVQNAKRGLISHFLLRPVTPFLASLTSRVLGLETSFLLVNLVLLVLTVYFTFVFTKAVFGEAIAFVSCACLSSLPIILYYAVGSRIDTGGFMFEPLLAYLALYRLKRHRSSAWYVFLGLLSGIAILSRENNVFIFLLLLGQTVRKVIAPRELFVILIGASVLPIIWMGYTGLTYLVTLNELTEIHGGYEGWLKNPLIAVRSFAGISAPVVLLSLIGLVFTDSQARTPLALLAASLLLPMLPLSQVPDVRMTFVFFPFVLPLAGLGLVELSKALADTPVFKSLSWGSWAMILTALVIAYNSYRGLVWLRLPIF